jgi:hypothetical protein
MPADCRQTLTGTVKTNGIVSGTWSGSYASGAGDTFSLTPKPPTAVASSPPQFGTGTYKAVQMSRGSPYQSMWTVTVKAGRITGLSTWTCCPGKRIDPLTGTVTGSRVVIHRDCSGQGMPADCRQTLTGTVKTNGIVSGTWSGSYASGSGDTFSLTPARSP